MFQATIAARPAERPAIRWPAVARVEALALVLLVATAGLIRLPYLWSIPRFTDETVESLRGFAVYQGRQLPLTNVAHYIGALHNYVDAAGFWILGPSVYTPRLVIWLLGALTVGASYLLAREMLPRPAAWLASALLATSGVHVAGSSHIAWSQCATPLFLTLGLALLYRAVSQGSGRSLLGAGFVWGLALQTHPTVLAFLPGAAAYLLWCGRGLFRTRWPYLAVCLFLLGYGNMVVYNAQTGLESIRSARARDDAYADDRDRDASAYLTQQGRIALTLLRLPAGAIDARPDAGSYVRDPLVLAYAGGAAVGAVLLARGGNPLPGLVVLSAVLLFPLFGARHELLPRQGRYLAPLLPLLFTALAAGAWHAGLALDRRLAGQGWARPTRHGLGLALAGLLVLLPLVSLGRYYAQSLESGQTNDPLFGLVAEIEASRPRGELVVLDYQLTQERFGGGGTALRSLDYLLTVRGIPHTDLTLEPQRLARRYGATDVLLVVTERTYRTFGNRLPLLPPEGREALTPPTPYGVYRLGAVAAQTGQAEHARAPGE